MRVVQKGRKRNRCFECIVRLITYKKKYIFISFSCLSQSCFLKHKSSMTCDCCVFNFSGIVWMKNILSDFRISENAILIDYDW